MSGAFYGKDPSLAPTVVKQLVMDLSNDEAVDVRDVMRHIDFSLFEKDEDEDHPGRPGPKPSQAFHSHKNTSTPSHLHPLGISPYDASESDTHSTILGVFSPERRPSYEVAARMSSISLSPTAGVGHRDEHSWNRSPTSAPAARTSDPFAESFALASSKQ